MDVFDAVQGCRARLPLPAKPSALANGVLKMRRATFGAAVALTTIAAGVSTTQAHSLYEAKDTLYGLGYYDVRVERASLPYSFNACKRGVRFHIHVNWYGDLVQVDEIGPCGDGGYRGYDDRPYRSYRYGRDY
jgi:hypothetical protein